MALPSGSRVGPYEVLAPLGAGGMGEVYRAKDARLGREVALKTLPGSMTQDADRLRRFETEARSTGLLNHPNILAVFDVGTHEGTPYVVSELLDGETLRERIGSTPLPLRKAVDYAAQVARGLAAAHEKGIVHRDLKPDNLFVTRDGRVKILDFGLAKIAHAEVDPETVTRDKPEGTDAGAVLGTVGYMSPEQVRGKPVDHRSDIFAFGTVLYEMLAGQRAFRGNSAVETMNAILKEDPPALSATNRQLPPALERIVAHCLEKSPEERFQSARDIAFDLEQLSGSSAQQVVVAPDRGRVVRRVLPFLLVAAAGVAIGLGIGRGQQAPAVSFRALTFQHGWVRDARFAPDGKQVVYQAVWPGTGGDVYVLQPGTPESRALNLKAALGAVSRTGELLIGRANGVLSQVPLGGGAPRDVDTSIQFADWAPDGTTMAVVRTVGAVDQLEYPLGTKLAQAATIRFARVSPDGAHVAFGDHPAAFDYRGDVAVVDRQGRKTTLSADWADVRGLAWSPDGKEVWFTATRSGAECSLWAVTLEGVVRPLFQGAGSLAIHDVAPDGRALVTVQRRRPLIYGAAAGDAKEQNLSWLDYGAVVGLTEDGRTLLFAEQGEAGGRDYAAYVRSLDGSLPVRISKGSAAAISRDGRLAVVIDLNLPMQASIVPTGVGAPRRLPRGTLAQIHAATFLRGNTRVVLCANEKDRPSRLFLQEVSGGDPRPISEENVTYLGAGIPDAPDGSVVAASAAEGRLQLYPTSGGAPREVPGSLPFDAPLTFSSDGRYLFVDTPAPGVAVFRIDLQTGKREPWRVVERDAGNPAAFVASFALSADGRSYAYTFRDDTSTLYMAEGLR